MSGISLFAGQAIKELKTAGADIDVTDEGLTVWPTQKKGPMQRYKRTVSIPYTDSLGSLVDAELVRKTVQEAEYFQRKVFGN